MAAYDLATAKGAEATIVVATDKSQEFLATTLKDDTRVCVDLRDKGKKEANFEGLKMAASPPGMEDATAAVVKDVFKIEGGENVFLITNPFQDGLHIGISNYRQLFEKGAKPILIIQPVKKYNDKAEPVISKLIDKAVLTDEASYVFAFTKEDLGLIGIPDNKGHDNIYNTMKTAQAMRSASHKKALFSAVNSPRMTCEIYLQTANPDYVKMRQAADKIHSLFEEGSFLHITTANGTDIRVDIKNKHGVKEVGDLKDQVYANIPTGEYYIAPGDGTNGVIVFDVCGSVYSHSEDSTRPIKLIEKIRVEIEKGYVAKDENGKFKITGGSQAKLLIKSLEDGEEKAQKEAERLGLEGDAITQYVKNTYHIGEFAIGLNEKAQQMGIIVVDEKIRGTCHFAFGNNFDNKCTYNHIDWIFNKPSIELYREDGTFITVMDEGELCVDNEELMKNPPIAQQRANSEMADKLLMAVGAKKGHSVLVLCDSLNKMALARAITQKASDNKMNSILVNISNKSKEDALKLINEKAKELGVDTRPPEEFNIINLVGHKALRIIAVKEFAEKDRAHVLHPAIPNAGPGQNPWIERDAIEGLLSRSLDELKDTSAKLMKHIEGARVFELTTYDSSGEKSATLRININPEERRFVQSLGDIRQSKAKWGNIGGEVYTAPSSAKGEIWIKKGTEIQSHRGNYTAEEDTLLHIKVGTRMVKHENIEKPVEVTVGLIDINSIENTAFREYLKKNPEFEVISEVGLGIMGSGLLLNIIAHDEKQGPHIGIGDQQAKRGTVTDTALKQGNYYFASQHTDLCFPDADLRVSFKEDPQEDNDWRQVYINGKLAPGITAITALPVNPNIATGERIKKIDAPCLRAMLSLDACA
ncbi:MAG: hypothetical protein V2A72_07195 [Candidatus Omnitrophota bacterium]